MECLPIPTDETLNRIAHVDHAKEYFTKYHSRKTPAYEDAWLGYAIYGGLMREPSPPSPPRRIVSVLIHPIFFFDDLRFAMNNLTTIVHWRSGKTHKNTLTTCIAGFKR